MDDEIYKKFLIEYIKDVFPLKKIRVGKTFRNLFIIPYELTGITTKYYSPYQELQKNIATTEITKIMISVFGYKENIIKEVVKSYVNKK
jgi:hypothetical protein